MRAIGFVIRILIVLLSGKRASGNSQTENQTEVLETTSCKQHFSVEAREVSLLTGLNYISYSESLWRVCVAFLWQYNIATLPI